MNMKLIMGEIHKNNSIFPYQTICLPQAMLDKCTKISPYDTTDGIYRYRQLSIGLYLVEINTKQFIFYLTTDLSADEHVSIPNDLSCYVVNTSKSITGYTTVPMYEVRVITEKNGTYEMENAINGITSASIISGNTAITNTESSVSPLHPNTFTSIRDITIQSASSVELLEDSESKVILNSPFYLNSLPNGVLDYLVMNSKSCFIINKIGRLKITGNEVWEKVDELSTNTYSVFFLEYDLMKQDNGMDAIICTHFPSTSYDSLAGGITAPNGIACANTSSDKHGIYIMIANSFLNGKDIMDFKNFLRDAYRTNNPVVILHELDTTKIKNISVNEYHLQTFFPRTVHKTNYPANVAICTGMVYFKQEEV